MKKEIGVSSELIKWELENLQTPSRRKLYADTLTISQTKLNPPHSKLYK
jgi:hypothetical protein